jgi:hypothetical protein
MHCYVCNWHVFSIYLKLFIIKNFNFGYLSYGESIFTWASMWGSVVIFRSQKGTASKNVWATLIQMTDGIRTWNPRIRKSLWSGRIISQSSFTIRSSHFFQSTDLTCLFRQFPFKSTCPPSFSFETKMIRRTKKVWETLSQTTDGIRTWIPRIRNSYRSRQCLSVFVYQSALAFIQSTDLTCPFH